MNDLNVELNKIKIKDLMVTIKKGVDSNSILGLVQLKSLDKIEKYALEKATDEDLNRIEKLFVEIKSGIRYYPSQNKKVVGSKVLPIDHII